MRAIAVIQARLASSRLYGKVLHPIAGRPLLEVLRRRLDAARVDEVWLATTQQRSDDLIVEWARALGMRVHRGSEEDVLSRFTAIARETRAEWIVRLTADDPFTDADIVNRMLAQIAESAQEHMLFSGYRQGGGLPLGYAPGIVRADALLEAEAKIGPGQDFHRAHVTSWVAENHGRQFFDIPAEWPLRPNWRWTVDTAEDARMAQAAFAALGDRWREARYVEMVDVLDRSPQISALNSTVQQKSLQEG